MSSNELILSMLILSLIIVGVLQHHRINKIEAGIRWFAAHIRIDDRDLVKDPPPEDLQAIIDSFDGHDEL